MSYKKFANNNEAAKIIKNNDTEYAVIQNPAYIFPEIEISPLAKTIAEPADSLVAVVMDMDGTTTTTEEICIHSLEYMVRRITNRMDKNTWAGLDHVRDYPHIIGNSTTKHVEYLINTYKSFIDDKSLRSSFIQAALWTLLIGQDESRKRDVTENVINLGIGNLLSEKKFLSLASSVPDAKEFEAVVKAYTKKYSGLINTDSFENIVRAAIDIYYQRYHEILVEVTKGNADKLAKELLADKTKHLIEPLPGVGIFLAMVKGLLGDEIVNISDLLVKQYHQKNPAATDDFNLKQVSKKLLRLSRMFEQNPLKVAVVTSSIYYEANIVLSEVFRVLLSEVKSWNISTQRKKKIIKVFSGYKNVYDGFVTASDSNEIRLKPHRDLYSIALHKLAISRDDFTRVVGFEDSESGTISIRTAGIGRCVAVPFAQTAGHNLHAAAFISYGGLPEVLLKHNLFIK